MRHAAPWPPRLSALALPLLIGLTAVALHAAGCQTECVPITALPDAQAFPADHEPPGKEASSVRFFAIGDGGTGKKYQQWVANAVAAKCAKDGCDFGLYLGDVIYPCGVRSVIDSQFYGKFEKPYRAIEVPIYVILGNHDYGDENYDKALIYRAYAQTSDRWRMPAAYYALEWGPAQFLAFDTDTIRNDYQDAVAIQGEFFSARLAASSAPWQIAFGHHPYLSNGAHGSAYGNVAAFYEKTLCGKVDLFLAGHDHDLEVLPGTKACPGTFVVSGGGGAELRLFSGGQPSHFQLVNYGFAYFHVTAKTIQLEIIGTDGVTAYSTAITQ